MLSLTMAWVVLGFALLAGAMGNVMQRQAHRVQVQAAADSAAVSAATLRSRGLNAVTANNHLIGELTALLVIHEALNGEPSQDRSGDYSEWNSKSQLVRGLAFLNFADSNGDSIASDANGMKCSATLYDTRMQLMSWTVVAQLGMIIGEGLEKVPFPPVAAVGIGLKLACKGLQAVVYAEWKKAQFLERAANAMDRMRDPVSRLLKFQTAYGDFVSTRGSLQPPAEKLVAVLSERNHVRSELFPSFGQVGLPVQREDSDGSGTRGGYPDGPKGEYESKEMGFVNKLLKPIKSAASFLEGVIDVVNTASDLLEPLLPDWMNDVKNEVADRVKQLINAVADLGRRETYDKNPAKAKFGKVTADWPSVQRSQYCRTAYPIVDSLRRPFLGMFNNIVTGYPLGNASNYYARWTARMTLYRTVKLREEGVHVYRMVDSTSLTKGDEPWTKDSDLVDEYFAVSAICSRPLPKPFTSIFGDPPTQRFVATSQAISYPTAMQLQGTGRLQPHVGWDTLAWDGRKKQAIEYPEVTKPRSGGLFDFSFLGDFVDSAELPPTRLSWDAKLVPHREFTYFLMKQASEGDELEHVQPQDTYFLNHH